MLECLSACESLGGVPFKKLQDEIFRFPAHVVKLFEMEGDGIGSYLDKYLFAVRADEGLLPR